MGEWCKVEPYRKGDSPCDGCEVGWASWSQKIVKGEFYTKSDSCQETCERYKKWLGLCYKRYGRERKWGI